MGFLILTYPVASISTPRSLAFLYHITDPASPREVYLWQFCAMACVLVPAPPRIFTHVLVPFFNDQGKFLGEKTD